LKEKKRIIELISARKGPIGFRELAEALHLKKKEQRRLSALLRRLTEKGVIAKDDKGRYQAPSGQEASARLHMNPRGFGFAVFEDPQRPDLYIPPMKLNGAFHGDIVRVREEFYKGKKEGRITAILRRGFSQIVGMASSGYLMPLDRNLPEYIPLVYPKGFPSVADETVISATITRYSPLEARALDIIGDPDDPAVDDKVVFALYHLDTLIEDISPERFEELKKALEKETENRKDLRALLTLTVDPAEAKDHDDAVSIEEKNDGWRLYVHIADVSFFLKEDEEEDRHAFQRGFSVYCEDYYRPMLPPAITGELCSLKEGMPRLAMSVMMDVNRLGQVEKSEIIPSAVQADRFLSYEEFQDLLDGKNTDKTLPFTEARMMMECARALNKQREARGALDLDMPETRIILDEKKRPVALMSVHRGRAHRIIEEFMIAANEAVARFLEKREQRLLFRTHESPSEESLGRFSDMLEYFGLSLSGDSPEEINRLLKKIHDRPFGPFLKTQLLKSLKQARYTDVNYGHYGLQSTAYTHFTSPIRRYSDLVIHRILKGRIFEEEELFALGKVLSEKERVVAGAEQRSREIKILRYLDAHRDEFFKGVVTWVGDDKAAVELESLSIEGQAFFKGMRGDPRQLTPGLEGRVRIASVEPLTGYLEVELIL
jgi:ribonuclease R